MSSSKPTPPIGVNNILSFNGHGAKASGKFFTLDPNSNVYILVPFGIGVELPTGSKPSKTDESHKGLDVCYTSFSPGAGSFEEIIYDKDGKLKLVFSDKKSPSSQNVDAKWHLYKPGDVVPNVNYFAWKKGDTAATNAKTCKEVLNEYDTFISTIMKECLNLGSDKLNKKVCALFVSDSKKTTISSDGKTTSSAVFEDDKKNYHLKLKICGSGDDTTPTTTLQELANNCRELVDFSKDVVKTSKTSSDSAVSSVYASGYDDANILPKSGPTDPIILMPFTCNSCDSGNDIELKNDTSDLTKVATLSEIIASLAGGGDGGSSGSSGDPPSTPRCNIDTSGKNITDITTECQDAIFSFVAKPVISSPPSDEPTEMSNLVSAIGTDYSTKYADEDIMPAGSASLLYIGDTQLYDVKPPSNTNKTSVKIKYMIQASPAKAGYESDVSRDITKDTISNSVMNSLILAAKNGVETIIFPFIGGEVFYGALKAKVDKENASTTKYKEYDTDKHAEVLVKGVTDFYTNLSSYGITSKNPFKEIYFVTYNAPEEKKDPNDKNKVTKPAGPLEHEAIQKAYVTAKAKYPDLNSVLNQSVKGNVISNAIFYSDQLRNKPNIAIVNAANTQLAFGTGVSNMCYAGLTGNLNATTSDKSKSTYQTKLNTIKTKFIEAFTKYITDPSAASSPPATSSKPKVAPSKPLDEVIKELIVGIEAVEDNEATLLALKIQEPLDGLVYKYSPLGDGSSQEDKNLNSAGPTIDVMIKGFESAVTGDDTNFYLGACRSIQAAYKLKFDAITGDENSDEVKAAKMRAKLLLNLRKNSLLLKVPAWWDYAKMELGEAPALTPDQVKAKYEELQQECETLKKSTGDDYATSEEAYKLAEQLIPLDTEIENEKLEKKNKVVIDNYPDNKITYTPIKQVIHGFDVIIQQHAENCGRAALANFFGTEDFLIKGDPEKTEEIFDLKNQRPKKINMSSICHLNKKYSDIFIDIPNIQKEKEDYEYVTKCPTSENYSINVLSIVLQVLGYIDLPGIAFDKSHTGVYSKNKDNLNNSYNNKDVLGYLVNINKGHWVCYKREDLGSTTNLFYRIDSMTSTNFNDAKTLEKLVEYDSMTLDKNFIQLHPITKNDDSNNQKIFSELTKIDEGNKNYYKDQITKNETNNKWKLFKKDITSLLVKESIHSNDINNQVRIMNYLSNLPSNKSNTNNDIQIGLNDEHVKYGSIQSKILSLTPEKKQQVIDIFIQYINKNLNTLNFITANNFNLRNIAYDKNNNLYEPDSDAKNRYYYSLTQTCNYKTGADGDFSKDLTSNGYYKSANTLLESIDTLFKKSEFTDSSPGGGGFKPRHNAITNHSKSKHNSSFKASSSKSKTKTNSRSHTQRVK
jgi:O-acetyl-ADP-ribose deacetylase (regulator of RNase III)